MANVSIAGVNIYYEVHGRGEPLILLHHGFGSTKMWEDLLPGFAAKYKVVSYDRRGFGESDKGEHFPDYYRSEQYNRNSIEELSILLEYLNIKDEIRLLGQCEGGVIGFYYAAHYPQKVKAVAISSTLCYSKIPMSELNSSRMFSSFEEADSEFQHKLIYWHGETWARQLYSLAIPGGGAYGIGVFDLRDILKNIQCPSLVLYPDRSKLFEVEQGVLMYRSLPKGELAVLPYCGHNTYALQPDQYQRIILSFLERNR
jgi:pimeloyl-ACP methyl ester carboxylesterase